VTSRLRSYIYKDVFEKDLPPPVSAPGLAGGMQAASPSPTPAREGPIGGDPPASYQNVQSAATPQPSKVLFYRFSTRVLISFVIKEIG
jgi:poly(rC)-binding protein 2/3/4